MDEKPDLVSPVEKGVNPECLWDDAGEEAVLVIRQSSFVISPSTVHLACPHRGGAISETFAVQTKKISKKAKNA